MSNKIYSNTQIMILCPSWEHGNPKKGVSSPETVSRQLTRVCKILQIWNYSYSLQSL